MPIQLRAPFGSAPVLGMSMYPTLHPGTLVFVRAESHYRIGEIVAFNDQEKEKIVLHRIVAVDGDSYVTRGDNNPVDDPYHPTKGDIYGKMYWDVPRMGGLAAWLRTQSGLTACLGLILLILVLSWLRGRKPKAF